jgi:hypothetical protein
MAAAFRCAIKGCRLNGFSILLLTLACTVFVSSIPDSHAGTYNRPLRLSFASDKHPSIGVEVTTKLSDPAWQFGSSVSAGLDGEVYVIAEYRGNLVATGDFVYADSEFVNGIAYFDGESWNALGSGVVGEIYAMYVLDDVLYVGGEFTEIGGLVASNLAAWDGDTWSVDHGMVDGPVYDVGTNVGKLAIVGDFTEIDGISCNNFGCLDETWSDFGFTGAWDVEAIYEDVLIVGEEPDTEIYYTLFLGGDGLATLDETGEWTEFEVNGYINDIEGYRGFTVAGGLMDLVDGAPCDNVVAWDGSNWVEFGPSDYEILDVCRVGEKLYAAGRPIWDREELDVASRFRVQVKAPESWEPARTTPVPNGPVNTMTAINDSLVVGGLFDGFYTAGGDMISGIYTPNLAHYYENFWVEFGIGSTPLGFDNKIEGSLVMDDKILFYGNFMSVNGDVAGGAVFFDGVNWTTIDHGPVDPQTFDPDLYFLHHYDITTEPLEPDFVDTMMDIRANIHDNRGLLQAVMYHDALYVAGDFYYTNSDNLRDNFRAAQNRMSIASLSGSSWFLPNTSLFPRISDMAVYDDLLVFVSREALGVASYNSENGVLNRNIYPVTFVMTHIYNHNDVLFVSTDEGIFRLDSTWVPLGDGRMANARFFSVGDELWASPDGGDDGLYVLQGDTWERIHDVDGSVLNIANYNGDTFIAGDFDAFDGQETQGLVYLHDEQVTLPDAGITMRDGTTGRVTTLGNFFGNLLVGGLFDLVGSTESPNLARWNSDLEPPVLTVGIHQNPYSTNYIDVYVMGDDSPLLPTDMSFQIEGEDVFIQPMDAEGNVWRAEYVLSSDNSDYEVAVSAVDYSWIPSTTEIPFAAKSLTRTTGGSVKSADGALTVNVAAEVLDHDTMFMVTSGTSRLLEGDVVKLGKQAAARSIERSYTVSPGGQLAQAVEVVFSLNGIADPMAADARGWNISRPDGTRMDAYYDPATNTVRTFTSELGSFQLSYDGQLPVALYDNAFLSVSAAHPNPFNPMTRIDFEIKAKGHVNADVFDLKGRRVFTLLDAEVLPGTHQLVWTGKTASGQNASSGIYMVRINAADQQVVRKITLLK